MKTKNIKLDRLIITFAFIILIMGCFIFTIVSVLSRPALISKAINMLPSKYQNTTNVEEQKLASVVEPNTQDVKKVSQVDSIKVYIAKFEDSYNTIFTNHLFFAEYFGIMQKFLNKREIKNFNVIKDYNNILYVDSRADGLDEELVKGWEYSVEAISKQTQRQNADFLFVQVPYKNPEGIRELKYYENSFLNEEHSMMVNDLNKKGINVLDLRKYNQTREVYRTDHHWTVKSAFYATNFIVDNLNKNYSYKLDLDFALRNIKNYEEVKYPKSFLGSAGIRTGEYYAGGKDDFSILNPLFKTDLTYKHIIKGQIVKKTKGKFLETFIDQSLLDNKKYNNKYDSLLQGGYVENIILNKVADNNKKVLLISHSYGRPLAQYLSLYFKETRYLDPQADRYEGDCLNYIKNYKPDLVIVMCNNKINVG